MFIVAAFISVKLVNHSNCLPSPFLYITTHDSNNIMKFTRDGCTVTNRVVWYGAHKPQELREMAVGKYLGEDVMFMADAADTDLAKSQIVVIGRCSRWNQMRAYITSIRTWESGGFHPYSVSVDAAGDVYASFQHSDGVLRFHRDTLQPMPAPLSIQHLNTYQNSVVNSFKKKHLSQLPNGTFVQFGRPGVHNLTEQGIRGIAWVPVNFTAFHNVSFSTSSAAAVGVSPSTSANNNNNSDPASPSLPPQYLWIANEDLDGVFVVDKEGMEVARVSVRMPIGLHYDHDRGEISFLFSFNSPTFHSIVRPGIVYVGSKSRKLNGGGSVMGIDINSFSVVKTFTLLGKVGMKHPTGITHHKDMLFVGDQSVNAVLTFNITTQRYLNKIVTNLPSPIESIALSDC